MMTIQNPILKGIYRMSIDLDKMKLPELIQLQKELTAKIKEMQKTERISLRRKMEELAEESGFTFEEVISGAKPSKKSKVKPKYINPNNSEQTWTGRGRKPKWVEAALADGKKIEDLLI